MSKIIYILTVSIILHIATIRTDNVDPKGTKIIGGIEVKPGQAKFMVSIHCKEDDEEYQICGGSLISTTNILTAAHCFHGDDDETMDPSKFFVIMGSIKVDGDSKAFKSDISNYVHHQDFNLKTYQNDVALIIFEGIKLNKYPNVGIMKLTNRKEEAGQNCTVYGWGLTDRLNPDSYSDVLRQVNVSILDFDRCKSSLENLTTHETLFHSEFCAGSWAGGKDSCTGDSGGPLVCDGKQFGIVSSGVNCSLPNYPGIYQSVHYFKSWIENDYKTLGKFGNSEIVKINNFLIIYLIFMWIFM